ncbi:MAG: 6,7-dimethyl-8-ribityllumazine synthase [Myxococcota bacterium]|nr:6,7-dimethyl-8-ribityllumazine synthase [Myxococcota bacterium]
MPTIVEGGMVATGKRFAIVVSRWNEFFGESLLEGALDTLRRHGVSDEDVTVYRCPGCFELPLVAKRVAQKGGVDAIICLGVLIRGSTPHFDYICSATTSGIASVGLEHDIHVSYGVITCDSLDQAIERSGSKVGNKGHEATLAAIEMANLFEQIGG